MSMLDRPKIEEVIPLSDYTLDIKLSDNRKLKLNMQELLKSPAYQKLSHIGLFLSVKHDDRLIYWDDMHDMHIDQIVTFADEVKPG